MTIQTATVGHVPAIWADVPPPFFGALVFRVGWGDETFVTNGVTHLVEHLVLDGLERPGVEYNGEVDAATCSFYASGRRDSVLSFLTDVATRLEELPTDRIDGAVRVLRRELDMTGASPVRSLLMTRFGARSFGLAGAGEPGLEDLTADDLEEHQRAFFHADNCVVVLGGDPAGFTLGLSRGARPTMQPVEPLRLALPARTPDTDHGITVTALTGRTVALVAAFRIVERRALQRLRAERGLVYDLDVDHLPLAPDHAVRALHTHCADEHVVDVWDELRRLLGDMSTAGPSADELAYDVDDSLHHLLEDPNAVLGELRHAAFALLHGIPHRDAAQIAAEVQSLTPSGVAEALAEALPTLLVAVPEDVPDLAGLPRLPGPEGERLTGTAYARRLRAAAPRGSRLVVGDAGVCLELSDGCVTVRFDRCVGLVRHPDGYCTVVDADGTGIPLHARDWRGGDEAVNRVLARVPQRLWLRATD